jgi:hypothetical protein
MIFKDDPFKHGFYEVNGYRTFSKFEAIEIQKRTGMFPEWNFNRSIFDKLDWTKEPSTDLWEMYKARARQIRDAYDYVVLFYSGGSDSVNILTAWLEADLKIDEIASVWNTEGSKVLDDYMNAEVDRVVLPGIQRLKNKGIEFKFRLIDITEDTISFVKNAGLDYPYYANKHFSPNNIIKSHFREKIPDYVNMINQGKSVCFIWGCEKPQIFPEGDRHYFQFFDMMDNCVSPYSQQRVKQGWYDELFYWSPDMPELVVKQAHTLLNFIEKCDMPQFYQNESTQWGYNKKLKKYITPDAAKIILYPKWDPTTFSNGKGVHGMIYSARDVWFWTGNADGVDMMKSISKAYVKTLGNYWINNEKVLNVKSHCSPKYYLN